MTIYLVAGFNMYGRFLVRRLHCFLYSFLFRYFSFFLSFMLETLHPARRILFDVLSHFVKNLVCNPNGFI